MQNAVETLTFLQCGCSEDTKSGTFNIETRVDLHFGVAELRYIAEQKAQVLPGYPQEEVRLVDILQTFGS